jgi:hypothetical protein
MACRDRNKREKIDAYDYCILEVMLTKRGTAAGAGGHLRAVTVDNHFDTLRFVQENLDACISNIVRLQRVDDSAAAAPERRAGSR